MVESSNVDAMAVSLPPPEEDDESFAPYLSGDLLKLFPSASM